MNVTSRLLCLVYIGMSKKYQNPKFSWCFAPKGKISEMEARKKCWDLAEQFKFYGWYKKTNRNGQMRKTRRTGVLRYSNDIFQ
uniref:Uncharacterized protein n=1 Tax=Romanomermis culicivorax TaxID=13658 RepID=A0A915HEI7_ROMCU